LAAAAAHGYSETALQSAAPRDPAALAIAREHDPYAAAGTEAADREDRIASFADDLQARRALADKVGADPSAKFSLASLTTSAPATPARPFRLRGALEESRDLECLTQAVYYEARGEGAAGQEAVAQVVLNRTRHPAFPKTICGVVFQGAADGGCQFSFACDGSVRHRVEPGAWRRAEKIAARALDGFVMAEVGNATHFHVASLSTNWGPGLLRVAQIGAHVFYSLSGRHAAPATLTAKAQPVEPPTPTVTPAPQPVYASLSLPPLGAVANSVASSVAGAAELVMSAAQPKAAAAATKPAELAIKPGPPPPAAGQAAVAQPVGAPAPKADEPIKTATIS
jgi:hypothetical protein